MLLAHVLPFTMLLGSILAFFLQMSDLVRPISVRLVHATFSQCARVDTAPFIRLVMAFYCPF